MKTLCAKPLILLITLLTVFSVSFFVYNPTTEPTLLSYKVTSYDEAVTLSDNHNLTLHHVSPSGIATFETDKPYDSLLEKGFAVNHKSSVQAPPFNTTDDPLIDDQYALTMMNTYDAWDVTTGEAHVTVAIIDTGIDIDHTEFQGRLSPLSYNATTEQQGLEHVIDDQDHGTPVAGIIAANKDNGEGIAGIAQAIELLIIKANESGEDTFFDSVLAEAIYYAVDNGADIINMSLGGSHENQTVQDAITYAYDHDVLVVAAAGNDGMEDPQYPAAYDHVIAVSSVDDDGLLSEFSNYGDYIDITAPGGRIVTTGIDDVYYGVSGTSFAAPQITGVLALIKSLDETQTHDAILNNLYGGTTNLNDPLYYGAGLVNTYQSVSLDYIKLTFDTDYDSREAIYHPQSDPITDLPTLNTSEKLFLGWYLDDAYTVPFEDGTILNADTTLYAKWVDETYTLTYMDDTTIIDETTYSYQDTPTVNEPTKDGYTFNGWYLDSAFSNAYTPEPITNDLTLYAKFDPLIYHTVTIMSDDQAITSYDILDDTAFDRDGETKDHFTFNGYFTDASFTTPFDSDTPITDDITLYAKFIPNTYHITYIHNDIQINEHAVEYGDTFSLPTVTDDTQYFIGWYLDDTFNTPYDKPDTLSEDTTLYAYFTDEAYEITLYVDDTSTTYNVLPESAVELTKPEKTGHVFVDWYIDPDLNTVFTDTTFTQDITLYAGFAKENYTVTFYDYDQETILQEMTVSYNDYLPVIPTPSKPSNTHFTYTFNRWETDTNSVTSDMDIYPLFDKNFITSSVTLNPGIDTVNTADDWENAGLTYDDTLLEIETQIPDMSSPGTYVIQYIISDTDNTYETRYRYVTVRTSQPPLELSLKKGITTLFEGDTFTDPGVLYPRGTLTVESNVNTDIPGVYTITYILTDNNQTIQKIRYVHVLTSHDIPALLSPTPSLRKKEATL